MSRCLAAAVALPLTLAALATGCGSSDSSTTGSGEGQPKATLTVFAASSLEPAFEEYAKEFPEAQVEYSFAGSDTLEAQIKQGAPADVYASANTTYPDDLHKQGLLKQPTVFATNKLVVAVPAGSDITSVDQLAQSGVTLAIGEKGVPIGDYTREVIGKLGQPESDQILANVASEEPDVAGIVGKLTQGAVDAGFVYQSDVAASSGKLTAIALPKEVSPDVAYGAGVTTSSQEPQIAQKFIDGLIDGAGAKALAGYDFGAPPGDAGQGD